MTGKVFDEKHVTVASATVYIQREGETNVLTTKTDASGMYKLAIAGGHYYLRTEAKGKTQFVLVVDGKVTSADLAVTHNTNTEVQFFDEPQFTVAGVTDNTYRGGHGSDIVLRSSEELAKATASLGGNGADKDETHHALAEMKEQSGHPLEAVREFQHAAEINPSEGNLFDWGTELLSHRAPQAAEEVFAKGFRMFPKSDRMMLGLAAACYAIGDYRRAAQWFFEASDLEPDNSTPYLFLGRVEAREITQTSDYEQRMARFAKLQPRNALAKYYHAVSLWNIHRNPDALHLLKEAIALDPHLAIAHLELGIIYAANQMYREAVASYRSAIDESPNLEEAHFRLSQALRVGGNRAQAEEELATYQTLSKKSSEKLEHERKEVQQFVIALRQTSKTQ